jgi:hypothetical protein
LSLTGFWDNDKFSTISERKCAREFPSFHLLTFNQRDYFNNDWWTDFLPVDINFDNWLGSMKFLEIIPTKFHYMKIQKSFNENYWKPNFKLQFFKWILTLKLLTESHDVSEVWSWQLGWWKFWNLLECVGGKVRLSSYGISKVQYSKHNHILFYWKMMDYFYFLFPFRISVNLWDLFGNKCFLIQRKI